MNIGRKFGTGHFCLAQFGLMSSQFSTWIILKLFLTDFNTHWHRFKHSSKHSVSWSSSKSFGRK